MKKGLENSFTGPFKVLERFDKYFIIETFKGCSKISIDRLQPAYTLDFVNDQKIKSKNNNDSFISSRNISTSTSAATVTKDSRRRPYENNLYFTAETYFMGGRGDMSPQYLGREDKIPFVPAKFMAN